MNWIRHVYIDITIHTVIQIGIDICIFKRHYFFFIFMATFQFTVVENMCALDISSEIKIHNKSDEIDLPVQSLWRYATLMIIQVSATSTGWWNFCIDNNIMMSNPIMSVSNRDSSLRITMMFSKKKKRNFRNNMFRTRNVRKNCPKSVKFNENVQWIYIKLSSTETCDIWDKFLSVSLIIWCGYVSLATKMLCLRNNYVSTLTNSRAIPKSKIVSVSASSQCVPRTSGIQWDRDRSHHARHTNLDAS